MENAITMQTLDNIMRDADSIFRTWWKEVSRGGSLETRHAASHELRLLIEQSSEFDIAIKATLGSLHRFVLDMPQAIDFVCSAWAIAVDLIGQGAQSTEARQSFETYLDSFDQRLWAREVSFGHLRTMFHDPSNVRIPHPDQNVDQWTTEICQWQKVRRETIVIAAVRSRSFATLLAASIPHCGK